MPPSSSGRDGEVGAPQAGSPLSAVATAVSAVLVDFLSERAARLCATDPDLEPLAEAVAELTTAGGKRLRPAFVYWGYRSSGRPHTEAVIAAAAAVELFHAFALLQDDVMDHADQRRGKPTAHGRFTERHRRHGHAGDSAWFGSSAAILAGDLAAVWANEMFEASGLPAADLAAGRTVFARLQEEVLCGQYLELWTTGADHLGAERALDIALLKSGRYTVTRPLQMGAAIGGTDAATSAALEVYGDNLGIAFQLRDDILGLYGDPAVTGKSAIGDLREGKRTLLVVEAMDRVTAADGETLRSILGRPDVTGEDADLVRSIVGRSGARAEVEHQLVARRDAACAVLGEVPAPTRDALRAMASLATERRS